ncbi:deoxyribonuclease-1-like 1 isoform X2 [Marmota marmota marmota]|uniref:deoxyribonuclease-1-like 1 isoform X2 n=1 Tax=Marmota flaviventris TaxID=93162 RepID=UPI000FFFA490|nr:deoxyribonuclease-1-like 1 isoform X2 [Marmota flaviventris]XP_048652680.1 deoxyribonuclease-1-like 1 isoform X2 [Marmota marmota marmota]
MHSLAAFLLILLAGGAEAFRICAFNTQRLTLAKVVTEQVKDTLVQIVARCDIMVLQEVVDSSNKTISLLLQELKRFDGSRHYSSLDSSRLGRSTYKEKYVYIYRSDKTQVLNSYQYEDEDDLFAREPFVAQFTLPSKILPSLVLVPLHTTPKDVEKELNALYNVFLDVSQRWQSKEVILLGDFNADCTSLPKKRLSQLLLRTEAGFHWVIPDGEDTTVRASTHCTYDRIVLHGEGCQSLLQAAAAFNFPKSFHLTEEEVVRPSASVTTTLWRWSSIRLLAVSSPSACPLCSCCHYFCHSCPLSWTWWPTGVMSMLPLGLNSWSHPSSLFCPGAEVTLLLSLAFFLVLEGASRT